MAISLTPGRPQQAHECMPEAAVCACGPQVRASVRSGNGGGGEGGCGGGGERTSKKLWSHDEAAGFLGIAFRSIASTCHALGRYNSRYNGRYNGRYHSSARCKKKQWGGHGTVLW